MSSGKKFLGTACAAAFVALVAGPAAAGSLKDMDATLAVDVGHTNAASGVTLWGAAGALAFPLGGADQINGQLNADYGHHSGSGFSGESWGFGGDLFWAGMDGRAGLDIRYITSHNPGSKLTSGGPMGEVYFGDMFTVQAKAGWTYSGYTGAGGTGFYAGLGGKLYPMPNLAVSGFYDYHHMNSAGIGYYQSFYGVSGEFLFSEEIPVSLGAAIARTTGSGSSGDTSWLLQLKWYPNGGGTLINRQRNGALDVFLVGDGVGHYGLL